MEELNREQFDTWLSKSLEEHTSPVPVGGWKGLKNRKRRKRGAWLFRSFGVASILALALSASIGLFHLSQDTNNNSPRMSDAGQASPGQKAPGIANQPSISEPNQSYGEKKNGAAPGMEKSAGTSGVTPVIPETEPVLLKPVRPSSLIDTPTKTSEPGIVPAALLINPIPAGIISVRKVTPEPGRVYFDRRNPSWPFPLWYAPYFMAEYSGGFLEVRDFQTLPGSHTAYRSLVLNTPLRSNTWRVEAGVQLLFNGNLKLQTGLGYSEQSWNGHYNYNNIEPDPFLPHGQGGLIVDSSFLNDAGYYDLNYRAKTLSLPFRLSYSWGYRIRPFVAAGMQINWNFSEEGNYIDPLTAEPQTVSPGSNTQNLVPADKDFRITPRFRVLPEFSAGIAWNHRGYEYAVAYVYRVPQRYAMPGFDYRNSYHGLRLIWKLPDF